MKKLLFASHKNMAEGLKETLEFIMGEQDFVDSLCLYTEENPDGERSIDEYMSSLHDNDELIVLSDVYGGSVNNAFMKYINRKGFYLIAGMNLPLAMELSTSMDQDTDQQIENALNNTQAQIYCNELYRKISAESENTNEEEGI